MGAKPSVSIRAQGCSIVTENKSGRRRAKLGAWFYEQGYRPFTLTDTLGRIAKGSNFRRDPNIELTHFVLIAPYPAEGREQGAMISFYLRANRVETLLDQVDQRSAYAFQMTVGKRLVDCFDQGTLPAQLSLSNIWNWNESEEVDALIEIVAKTGLSFLGSIITLSDLQRSCLQFGPEDAYGHLGYAIPSLFLVKGEPRRALEFAQARLAYLERNTPKSDVIGDYRSYAHRLGRLVQ